MNQHTPGPWEVIENDNYIVKRFPTGERAVICELTHSVFRDAQAANAAAIAALPQLLAALTNLLAETEEWIRSAGYSPENQPYIHTARAAIAAATPGENVPHLADLLDTYITPAH
jgi:hypothetical protein